MYLQLKHCTRRTMLHTRNFKMLTIVTLVLLLRMSSTHKTESFQNNQHPVPGDQTISINVPSGPSTPSDLEAVESNIHEAIVKPPAEHMQINAPEPQKGDEIVIRETKHLENNVYLVGNNPPPSAPISRTTLVKQLTPLAPVNKQQSALKRVEHHAKSRMSKKEIPVVYTITKKVEYRKKKIQRRQGFVERNNQRIFLKPMPYSHIPSTVKFYIQVGQMKGPKGGKVYLPVMPQPADKDHKWSVDLNQGYKQIKPVYAHWTNAEKQPSSYVKFIASVPKKTLIYGHQQQYIPTSIPISAGHSYYKYLQAPVNQYHQGIEHFIEQPHFQSEHAGIPEWEQGISQQAHQSFVVPERPQWAQQESLVEISGDGFKPVALPHVVPTKSLGGAAGGQPTYVPSEFDGYAQYQAPRPGQHYAVREQTLDVPPPISPMIRPPGAPVPLKIGMKPVGSIQTPGSSALVQQQQQASPQNTNQPQLKPEYNQYNTQHFGYSLSPSTTSSPAGIRATNSNAAQNPALSAIQEFSPNFLRQLQYQHDESTQEPSVPWTYQQQQGQSKWEQPTQSTHPSAKHVPNLQVAYAWKQQTQGGKHVQVVQESRQEITKLNPNSTNVIFKSTVNHTPKHTPVADNTGIVIPDNKDNSSHHSELHEGSQLQSMSTKVISTAQTIPKQESIISNGWTPIINN